MDRRETPWIDGRFLTSRVARRIFFLMLMCALVPTLSFAVLSFQQVMRQVELEATARLEQDAKQLGMAVLERLLLLETSLSVLRPARARRRAAGVLRGALPPHRAARAAAPRRRRSAHLDGGGSLLRVEPDRTPRITLLRLGPDERLLAAEIEPRFLFVPDAVRSGVDLFIHAEGQRVLAADGRRRGR